MATINLLCEAEVNLSKIPDADFRDELLRRAHIVDGIKEDNRQDVLDSISPSDFETDALVSELKRRKYVTDPFGWIERAYRYLAEGDIPAAMEILHHEFEDFGLAPPSHERAIADLLSGRKGSSHV
jgi:hypothetical protein